AGKPSLMGAEHRLPYSRPPLSKGYLRGEERFEAQLVKPADYYTEQRIDLRLGIRATAIDASQKRVELEGGQHVAYDHLLVTTGGRNRPLSVPGAHLESVFQLRTLADSRGDPAGAPRGGDGARIHRFRGGGLAAPARPRGGGDRGDSGAPGPRSRRRGGPGARGHPSREGRGAGPGRLGGGARGLRTSRARADQEGPGHRVR